MNTYPEHKIVQKCLQEIEIQLDWGPSDKWHNDVFIELSEIIQEKTQILLSPTTLKRVWGKVAYKSAPSISTLNTLSKFANYDNWRDFKNKNNTKRSSWFEKKVLQHIGIIATAAAIMTIAFISFFSMIGSKKDPIPPIDLSKISFGSQPISNGFPNSVVFNYDIGTISSDSIYIQQYWDETKTIKIKPNQKQATGIYYFPGYFRAKLLIDGQITKEHDLFITSDDWIGTVDYEPVPKYIYTKDIMHMNLSLPRLVIDEIKSNKEPLTSTFHLVKDFKVPANNIHISTSVKNSYQEKWAVCQTLKIYVLGSTGAFVIPFSIPGCVSDINLMLNDVYLKGKENDLSAFGTDFSDFKNIDISIKEKKVTVFIDNKKIYSTSYHESLGRLVGIRYRFLGAGEVNYLKVNQSETETVVFDDNFKR
ncbi:hypothetical protein [Aquimarina sp. AU474]|uniref:hypothetical protein n=1 Tax=Aquimarina sp. AU474 TaxID=2108529 RepID=UPI000D68D7D2|nr:hypothetical protein [Aquimarina sp. AU474]